MSKSLRAIGATLAVVLAAAGAARAQELLGTWTLRTGVEAEALAGGAASVFWNPAGLGLAPQRGEVLAVALQSSRDLGLKGMAGAAALHLRRGTAVGLGYQHLGIDDIEQTTTAPESDGTANLIGVGEDRVALGASQPLGELGWAGALVEYDRSNSGVAVTNAAVFGAGLLLRWQGRVQPELGGSAVLVTGGTHWRLGAGLGLPDTRTRPLALRASYGLSGQSDRSGVYDQRLALSAGWRQVAVVSGAFVVSRSAGQTTVTPDVMGGFRVGRYGLGVVHESAANDFGGATSVHLSVRF
jgi:hypothetical protein